MKIQIDTNAKTIKIDGNVKLSDLFDVLQKFFPNGEWEDYDLETNTVINNWGNPIIINNPYLYPWWYKGNTYIVSASGTTTTSGSVPGLMTIDMTDEPHPNIVTSGYISTAGVYNIESN